MDALLSANTTSEARAIQDVVCTRCSCLCDDIEVRIVDHSIAVVRNACPLGEEWFQQPSDATGPVCRVNGIAQPLAVGIHRAAQVLTAAHAPVIYGFRHASCEALGRGIAVAERSLGTIDTAATASHAESIIAWQEVGKITSTLGEVRNRGDFVLFWGADPLKNQPRLLERGVTSSGRYLPDPGSRTIAAVDVRRTATTAKADTVYLVRPGSDFEALCALRALVAGDRPNPERLEKSTGLPLSTWEELAARMRAARYGVIVFGAGVMHSRGGYCNCQALFELVRDLNAHTRFVCRSVRQEGNVTGAVHALTWASGYPFGVCYSRGFPRYNDWEFTARRMVERNECDALLVVAADPLRDWGGELLSRLSHLPLIWIGPDPPPAGLAPQVSIRTARYDLATLGTVFRMDEVPLTLRPVLPSQRPSEENVLAQLEQCLQAASAHGD